ncbi:transcriptional regulator DEF1 isoform X2 [Humulus lupulus]|nr:transcriptional regulator DEF1 isoform X2 [Humulus lupulus]
MNHPQEEEENHSGGGHGGNENGLNKNDEIFPSYDFQPIRPIAGGALGGGASSHSPNFDATPNIGGSTRAWSSGDSKPQTGSPIRNYGSLDSIEPAKFILEKDQSAFNSTIVAEIDKTMKKHADNLLHVLDGVSARLTQLESRTRHLEESVDDLKISVGNNHGNTDGKMRQLENILREVQSGVFVLKDKQEILEAQLQLAKLQVSKVDQNSEAQNTVHVDSMQHAASAPQQSHQQLQTPVNLPSSQPTFSPPNAPPSQPSFSPPNAPPQPNPQQNLPPQVQHPNQFPQNQIPPIPQHEPYYPPPGQAQEPPNQQYQIPLSQQQLPPPAVPPHQQFQPQFSQPPTQPPQQLSSLPPINPSQLPPTLSHHHSEEPPYVPSQNYPPNLRQALPQSPSGPPPPSQQFYVPPSHIYDSQSSRPSSGFPSGYGPPSSLNEPFHYGGSPSQYGNPPAVKPQQLTSTSAPSGGSGYPQLPTARVLPQALPTASGVGGGSGSSGTGNRVPVDDVIDKVSTMGFPRDHVRATVRRLTENGQSVDLNIVLDKLMNEGEGQPPRGGWFGR